MATNCASRDSSGPYPPDREMARTFSASHNPRDGEGPNPSPHRASAAILISTQCLPRATPPVPARGSGITAICRQSSLMTMLAPCTCFLAAATARSPQLRWPPRTSLYWPREPGSPDSTFRCTVLGSEAGSCDQPRIQSRNRWPRSSAATVWRRSSCIRRTGAASSGSTRRKPTDSSHGSGAIRRSRQSPGRPHSTPPASIAGTLPWSRPARKPVSWRPTGTEWKRSRQPSPARCPVGDASVWGGTSATRCA